jgi:hypothetical protein
MGRYIIHSGAFDRGVSIIMRSSVVRRPRNYYVRLSRQSPTTEMATPRSIVFHHEDDILHAILKWNAEQF